MNVTIEQIKADIKSGACIYIYWSTQTPWWTHLSADLEDSTKQGRERMISLIEKKIECTSNPVELNRLNQALDSYKDKDGPSIPLDPSGAPLYMTDKPLDFIEKSEASLSHFGRHGISAFMMAHHQNTKLHGPSWDFYNQIIDHLN